MRECEDIYMECTGRYTLGGARTHSYSSYVYYRYALPTPYAYMAVGILRVGTYVAESHHDLLLYQRREERERCTHLDRHHN